MHATAGSPSRRSVRARTPARRCGPERLEMWSQDLLAVIDDTSGGTIDTTKSTFEADAATETSVSGTSGILSPRAA